ncbi:MAG: hypothetical protein K2M95_03575 [Clostridiales bacterium]|nr:hypothetical protein [Clostridiales bacterium]
MPLLMLMVLMASLATRVGDPQANHLSHAAFAPIFVKAARSSTDYTFASLPRYRLKSARLGRVAFLRGEIAEIDAPNGAKAC